MMNYAYGIVVPVRNEAAMLPITVPKLLLAVKSDPVRILWVCNGCTDDSAALIRRLAGSNAEVIEIDVPGKTLALQAGDDILGDLFPRIYLDADTWLRPGDLGRLVKPLVSGTADLVAPSLESDISGCTFLAARIALCWLSLPHAKTSAFSAATGLSAAGRRLWGRWPEISGDDIFVAATVPPERKLIVADAVANIRLPVDFLGWVRMRARWLRGETQLARLGLVLPRSPDQRRHLLCQMVSPRTMIGAWTFVVARLVAKMVRQTSESSWLPDRSISGVGHRPPA